MKRIGLMTLLSALLGACGQPTGNAQGLAGQYTGERIIRSNGSSTTYGFTTTTTTFSDTIQEDGDVVIEAGYESDAVLYGFPCVILLKGGSGGLELEDEAICSDRTETQSGGSSGGGATSTVEEERTLTFTDVTVKAGKDSGEVSITASATLVTVELTNGTKTAESQADLEYEFEGKRVAGE